MTGAEHGSHEVFDCSAVLADVWTFLDHECDAASRERLQRHLDECGPCLTAFGIEGRIKSLLSRKCGGERAPSTLRVRLSTSIRATMVDAAGDGTGDDRSRSGR